MKELAVTLGLERVQFSEPLYGDAKWTAYREADLFVLPTRSESFGMTVAESLAAGTPVIVTMGAPWQGPGSASVRLVDRAGRRRVGRGARERDAASRRANWRSVAKTAVNG